MSELATTFKRAHGEVVDAETGEIVPVKTPAMNLFGSSDPELVIAEASRHAKALANVIKEQQLYKTIGSKAHVFVEGWALLGSMLGVYAVPGEVEPVEVEGVKGFRATAEARTRAGEVVGAATAYCMRDEPNWKASPTYAVAAMAQTRASSMALRKPLGFVMKLAGYNPTPAEEIPSSERGVASPPTPASRSGKATQAQHAKLALTLEECSNIMGGTIEEWTQLSRERAKGLYGVDSRSKLTKVQMTEMIEHFQREAFPAT